MKLEDLQRTSSSFSFSYQISQVKLRFPPQEHSVKEFLVMCESGALPPTVSDCDQTHLFCSTGSLPMNVKGKA